MVLQERKQENRAARIFAGKRDLIFVFALEIFAVFLLMVQSPPGSRVEPLHFLCGPEYDWNLWNSKETEVWFLQIFLFAIVVLRYAEQYHEEASYMRIVRYCNWKQYYRIVLRKIILYIFAFHLTMACGLFCGAALGHFAGWKVSLDGREIFLSLVCFTLSNFLFGILASYCVVHLRSLKFSLVIYPVLPVLICFLRDIPGKTAGNLLPPNWAMLARSNFLETEGFWLLMVLGVEFLLTIVMGCIFVTVHGALNTKRKTFFKLF